MLEIKRHGVVCKGCTRLRHGAALNNDVFQLVSAVIEKELA